VRLYLTAITALGVGILIGWAVREPADTAIIEALHRIAERRQ
jgi:hypothetical protein